MDGACPLPRPVRGKRLLRARLQRLTGLRQRTPLKVRGDLVTVDGVEEIPRGKLLLDDVWTAVRYVRLQL